MTTKAIINSMQTGEWFTISEGDYPEHRWRYNKTWCTCQWCGKPMQAGERARWVFVKFNEKVMLNAFICYDCGHKDDVPLSNELLLHNWQAVQSEFFRKFWWMSGQEYFSGYLQKRVERLWVGGTPDSDEE